MITKTYTVGELSLTVTTNFTLSGRNILLEFKAKPESTPSINFELRNISNEDMVQLSSLFTDVSTDYLQFCAENGLG